MIAASQQMLDELATKKRRERRAETALCIRVKMTELGRLYRPDGPYRYYAEGSGWVLEAVSPRELQSALGMGDETPTHFKNAVSYLAYVERTLVRVHIKGVRHYKLLVNDD
jgi:hypothetical protein